jgi:tetratricopeptide (TPR) repeat protein
MLAGRADTDYYASPNVLAFADSLMKEGDYQRAATEYGRYLIIIQVQSVAVPAGTVDDVLLRQGKCFRSAGEYERAINCCMQIMDRSDADHNRRDEASLLAAVCYADLTRYDDALHLVEKYPATTPEYRQYQAELTATVLLRTERWQEARNLLDKTTPLDSDASARMAQLGKIADKGLALQGRRKSPTTAALLSAVIPGAGKVYAGHTADGIYAFMLVGVDAVQSYRAFHESGSGSTRGWVYGILAFTFYAGNIYGSDLAVRLGNQQAADGTVKEALSVQIRF